MSAGATDIDQAIRVSFQILLNINQDSVVGIAIGHGLDDRWV
jgi:hypothetical protein